MKNTVKFFLGGAVAAALILGVFAFTGKKQNENKEYLVVRVVENSIKDIFFVQICDKNGKVEIRNENLAKSKGGVYGDKEATHTAKLATLINEFANKGYKLSSWNPQTELSGGFSHFELQYTTIIFEK